VKPDLSLLFVDRISNLRALLGDARFGELCAALKTNLEEVLRRVEASGAGRPVGPGPDVDVAVHQLRGSCGALGFNGLADALERLETILSISEPPGASADVVGCSLLTRGVMENSWLALAVLTDKAAAGANRGLG
jgi:hypothetical protein